MSLYTMPIEILINKLVELTVKAGEKEKEFAIKESDFNAMNRHSKDYFSTIALTYEGSISSKEMHAHADDRWKQFGREFDERELALKLARADMNEVNREIDVMRTIISYRKSELNKFQG